MTLDEMLYRLRAFHLAAGSHASPDGMGNVCVNEAAIIAAGFPYRAVSSERDCPLCFSPVLSAYLIRLNDRMLDRDRQRLMPFVTRLSGSRDTDAVEIQRARYIAVETVRRLLTPVLKVHFPEHAVKCAAVEAGSTRWHALAARDAAAAYAATYAAARAASYAAADAAAWAARAADAAAGDAASYAAAADAAARAASYAAAADAAARAASYVAADAARAASYAAAADAAAWAAGDADAAAYAAAADAAARAASYAAAAAAVWTTAVEIAEGAFAIGNQAEPLDTALIVERMERAKERERV